MNPLTFEDRCATFYGCTIDAVTLVSNEYKDDKLIITFTDSNGLVLAIRDGGRCCCETRYLHTDDDLPSFKGKVFTSVEVTEWIEVGNNEDYDVHEKGFIRIHTNEGTIVLETHNIHNGYYSGITPEAKVVDEAC